MQRSLKSVREVPCIINCGEVMKILSIALLSSLILACDDTIADEDIQDNSTETSAKENPAEKNNGSKTAESSDETKNKRPIFGDIPAPSDVAEPPVDATVTASGLYL